MNYIHKDLANGRWQEFSLIEQMANVGSEISRTITWRSKNKHNARQAFYRALDLLALTLKDPKNKTRLREICKAKEMLIDWYFGSEFYNSTDKEWQKYFLQFNIAARLNK